jgi:hypothetical protein
MLPAIVARRHLLSGFSAATGIVGVMSRSLSLMKLSHGLVQSGAACVGGEIIGD